MKLLSKLYALLFGKNPKWAPKELITAQLLEKRPLPVGMTEWDEWADRIVSGSLLQAEPDSMKFALGTMILHLGPTESAKEDAFFIHSLRKSAANQIADAKMREIRDKAKARLAAEEAAKVISSSPQSEATTSNKEAVNDEQLLARVKV